MGISPPQRLGGSGPGEGRALAAREAIRRTWRKDRLRRTDARHSVPTVERPAREEGTVHRVDIAAEVAASAALAPAPEGAIVDGSFRGWILGC